MIFSCIAALSIGSVGLFSSFLTSALMWSSLISIGIFRWFGGFVFEKKILSKNGLSINGGLKSQMRMVLKYWYFSFSVSTTILLSSALKLSTDHSMG